ncbi:MAG: hypothetical protein E7F91_00580 [Veillonella sp.]|jgi:hypothetical protein|uniref:hypothetical protein n=1 Tax=Veillonella sp. TaxID=1926307 RepID=UPI002914B053|nr:hypothetical protein [Veillonella sp.]MDU3602674.1 hypothetical protein [Veillonella sp.]
MNRILYTIFPPCESCKANTIIKSRMFSKDESGISIKASGILEKVDNPENISTEVLKELYEQTFNIKNKLEDKAKSNIIGITISVSLIVGSIKLISFLPAGVGRVSIAVLLVIGVSYMILSGWLAIYMLIEENETYIIKITSLGEGETVLREDYSQCIEQNQSKNLIRNNYLFASYACIRNSLISLFIMFLIIIVSKC